MRRRGVLISVWVLATAAATLIAWAAVSQVTRQVAPQAVLPLPRTAAIAALSPTEQGSEAAVAQRDQDANDRPRKGNSNRADDTYDPAADEQASDGGQGAGAAPRPAPADDPPRDDTADPGPSQPDEADDAPQSAPEQEETAAAPVTQAYDLVGGVVTVRYSGDSTTLVEASPESGFVTEVNDGGPGKVDVRFRSDDHESRLVTRVRNGEPDPETEERPR